MRQGDPLSPYLFIIVSQNLTAILNHARQLNLVPGFSPDVKCNLKHLMYADDLILITTATRKYARNIKLWLNLYTSLTAQTLNLSKSNLYLPHWFNRRVVKSIETILNIKMGTYPFTYLGILITYKRLAISCFNLMIDKINKTIGRWNRSKISKPGKVVMINSSIMVMHVYYLSVYPVPDSILDRISASARKFLWANCSNGRGIPLVN